MRQASKLSSVILVVALIAAACSAPGPAGDGGFVGTWLDTAGRPVPDGEPEGAGFVLDAWTVSGHCDWDSAVFLLVAWPPGRVDVDFTSSDIDDGSARLFVRDPDRIFAATLLGSFDPDATLPDGATPTGLHRAGWEIWTTDDDDSIHLVGPGRTERWQRSPTGIWCA